MSYIVNEELEAILDTGEYEDLGEAFLSHVRQDSTGLRLVFDYSVRLRNDRRFDVVD